MSKYKSICVWDNVDNIIQIIESLIDFNSHKTDFYDSKYCSKEYEYYSLQSFNCNGKMVKIKKPAGVAYVFKLNFFY